MSRLVIPNPSVTLLLLLLAACAGPDYRAITDASIATTTGVVSAEAGPEGAMRYRDIPFAKPPVAGRRWAAPETLHSPESQITTVAGHGDVPAAAKHGVWRCRWGVSRF